MFALAIQLIRVTFPFASIAFPFMLIASTSIILSDTVGKPLVSSWGDMSFGGDSHLLILATLFAALYVALGSFVSQRMLSHEFTWLGMVWGFIGGLPVAATAILLSIPVGLVGFMLIVHWEHNLCWVPLASYLVVTFTCTKPFTDMAEG